MGLFSPKIKELDLLINKTERAMENNYKDLAQMDYREFIECFDEKKPKMKTRSLEYYEKEKARLEGLLTGFKHSSPFYESEGRIEK